MPQSTQTNGNEMELTAGIEITGEIAPDFKEILSPEALHFVAGLERRFGNERKRLIASRAEFQARLDSCNNPYGDGKSSSRIIDCLESIAIDDRLLIKRLTL